MNDFIIGFSDHLLQFDLISQKISAAVFEVLLGLLTVICFVMRYFTKLVLKILSVDVRVLGKS
jgi:hypothetical protein